MGRMSSTSPLISDLFFVEAMVGPGSDRIWTQACI